MRLDKFICKSTKLSRLEAVTRIRLGEVIVNGLPILEESTQVHENNTIKLNSECLKPRPFRYLMFHKKAGTICSNVDEIYPSLLNDLDVENISELHIAGRLDVDTTGMVLITDDGRWSFNITRPDKNCEKVYRVKVSKVLTSDLITKFEEGLNLQGEKKPTRPAKLEILAPREALLTIVEGKYHQVKRMFKAVGNRVISLHREKIGTLKLDIPLGQWRYLTDTEVRLLEN